MGDLFCNSYRGISPRKLFAFFPNTLLPNSQRHKTLSLQLISKLFQLAVPTSSVCPAFPGKLHPHFQLITKLTRSFIFPVTPLPSRQRSLFLWPPALRVVIVCVWRCLHWQWQPRTSQVEQPLLLVAKRSMIVGTVLFQSSSYGKEGKLLCCLGEEASEPGVSFTGMMLRVVMLCCSFPVSL